MNIGNNVSINSKLDTIIENQNNIIQQQKQGRSFKLHNMISFIIILILAYIVFDGWNKLVLQIFNKYYPSTNIKLWEKILFLSAGTLLIIILFFISGINIKTLEVAL